MWKTGGGFWDFTKSAMAVFVITVLAVALLTFAYSKLPDEKNTARSAFATFFYVPEPSAIL